MSEPSALIACEYSGEVREAFRRRSIDAYSCDLLPADDGSPNHYQCDVLTILDRGWDLMVAHPDCTYLCGSGLHWNKRTPGRAEKTDEALAFVRTLLDAPIPRIALENPVGCISTSIRPASQYIQPYDFGHDASKKTGLWLKNLPPLKPTKRVPGRVVGTDKRGKPIERWGNQTDSGQNRLGPSEDRWKERSRTYRGWAEAMAAQWAPLLWNGYGGLLE